MEKEERAAQAVTSLVIYDDSRGKVHGRFTLPSFEGAALKKALMAIATPKHRASTATLDERRTTRNASDGRSAN